MQLITFDFWLTLGKADPSHAQSRNEILLKYYSKYAKSILTTDRVDDYVIKEFGKLKKFYDEFAERFPLHSFSPEQCYALFLTQVCGMKASDPGFKQTMEDLEEDFRLNFFQYPPILYPGTKEVITDLAKTYELGVITNLNYMRGEWLRQYLKEVLPEISFVVSSDEIGCSKPANAPFAHAAIVATNVKHVEDYILHVGDNPAVDGEGMFYYKLPGERDKKHYFQINTNDKKITDIYEHLSLFSK